MSKLLFMAILFAFILLTGCSKQKSESTTSMIISFGALTGANFAGGALVEVKNTLTGEGKIIELTSPYNVTLPFGVWDLHFVGFEGSSNWHGPHACGGVSDYKFSKDAQTVQVQVTSADCSNEPYASVIASKSGKWDVAMWDQAIWQ